MIQPASVFARLAIALVIVSCLAASSWAENLFPLGVQDARIPPLNRGELRIGTAYHDGPHNLFQRQSAHRRLLELPALNLNLGLGERVEGQISYSYLRLQRDGQETRWGSGDTTFGFKLGLVPDCVDAPALALMVSTKLPNADDSTDFGTDEADNYIDLLTSHEFDTVSVHLNLGVAILGAPGAQEGQDDLIRYAAGLRFRLGRGALLLGVQGMDLGQSANQRGALQAGLRLPLGSLAWDIGASAGYVGHSENWSLRAGISLPVTMPRMLCRTPRPPSP